MHRFHVEIERKFPVLVTAIEHRAVMHIAGAVDKNIERPEFATDVSPERVDVVLRARVELAQLGAQSLKLVRVEIGRDHLGAFVGEFLRNGAADTLPGGSNERDLSQQPAAHARLYAFCPFNAARLVRCRPSLSKFSDASQRSKLHLRSGHSPSSMEYQALSRLRPLAIMYWRNVPS